MLNFIDRQAAELEEAPGSPLAYGVAFAAIVLARHLLEILAGQNPVYYPFQFYLHYALAYVAPFLALVLVLHLFAAVPLARVARLMVHVWALTLLPPLIDLVTGRGTDAIGYLRPDGKTVGEMFLHFLNPAVEFAGTTPGIRVEAGLAALLGAAYVLLRGRGRRPAGRLAAAAGAAAVGVYITALGFFTLPRLFEAGMLRLAGWDKAALYSPPVLLSLPEPLGLAIIDRLYTLYLVPLCLILAALCAWRQGWLQRLVLRVNLAAGVTGMIVVGFGIFMGLVTRRALETGLAFPAPLDILAALGLLLAGLLVPPAAQWLSSGPSATAGGALALAALILAFCTGPSTGALLLVALALEAVRRMPPLSLDTRQPAGAVAAGVAGLGLLGAGMSLSLGQEALMLMPHGMSLGLAASLALAALAGARPVSGSATGTLLHWPAVAPLLMPPAALLVLAWSFSAPLWALLAGLAILGLGLLPRLLSHPRRRLEGTAWVLALLLTGLAAFAFHPQALATATRDTTSRARYLIRQAMLAEDDENYPAAVSFYRRALQREPERAPVSARLGEILWRHLDDATTAEPMFRQALAGNPHDVAVLSQLAALLRQDGRHQEAADLLALAVATAPERPVLWWEYAATLREFPQRHAEERAALERYLQVAEGLQEERPFRRQAQQRLQKLKGGAVTP